MLKFQKLSTVALMLASVLSANAFADTQTEAKPEAAKTEATEMKAAEVKKAGSFNDEASYAVGVLFGSDLQGLIDAQKGVIDYNSDKVVAGIADVLGGKVKLENNKEITSVLQEIDGKLKAASEERFAAAAKKAEEEGKKFAEEFAKKDGVKKTSSGLLYRIVDAGKGNPIKETDVVKVHYTGKLADGTVFDSSRERNVPAEFPLNQVIKGWTEGLQLVKKGGKIELVLPADLAYGKEGAGASIPPNATLYFDVEVLDVIPAKK